MAISGRVEAMLTVPSGVEVSATTDAGGPTTIGIDADSYYLTAAGGISGLLAHLQNELQSLQPPTSGAWSVTLDPLTGQVTIDCDGTWSLAWTSTELRDLLGFDADIVSASTPQTGPDSALGVWCPDAAMDVGSSDPRRAPKATDLRTTTSPRGQVRGLIGNVFYRHRDVTWPLVPENRVWEAAATVDNGSWETFVNVTQFREGLDWFAVSSPIQIYNHNGNLVGESANAGAGVEGWQITGIDSIEPKRYQSFTGLWSIVIPEIVSRG